MVWPVGHQLQNGKYRIEAVLRQGGFGITYKALHTHLQKYVVIKTPFEYKKHDPNYEAYIAHFLKEGQRLARLPKHPHIVQVWDLSEESDIPLSQESDMPYIVMDFVPGENLFQLTQRRKKLSEAEILPCIHQIGEALTIIHQAGLIHRDVHPGNIIIRPDKKAILIDFGIAKDLIPSTQTSTGAAGNPSFAPYEQRLGSREPTVDIYSLAATLYYALTGEYPATSFDRKVFGTRLIPPKQIQSTISEFSNRAIIKGMALKASARPRSMKAWLNLLKPPRTAPPPPPNPTNPRPRSSAHEQNRVGKIPWEFLAGITSIYVLLGVSLYLSSAPFWIWIAVSGLTLTLTLASVGSGPLVMALAFLLGYGSLVVILGWASPLVGFRNFGYICAGSLAMVLLASNRIREELLTSFSKFHTFLILLGTSVFGLGLGWLFGMLVRLSG
jgi:serine/threonine protein kinase